MYFQQVSYNSYFIITKQFQSFLFKYLKSAFQKFDDINKQLEKKDELIKSLQNKIDASENDNNLNIG